MISGKPTPRACCRATQLRKAGGPSVSLHEDSVASTHLAFATVLRLGPPRSDSLRGLRSPGLVLSSADCGPRRGEHRISVPGALNSRRVWLRHPDSMCFFPREESAQWRGHFT